MLERSVAATALAELGGQIVYVNPAFLKLWGYARASDVLGRAADDTFWNDPDAAGRAWQAVLQDGGWQGALIALRADGSQMPVWCSAHRLDGPDGSPRSIMGSFIDRSAEVSALEALRRSERQLQHAQEVAGIGSWQQDIVTGRLEWSEQVYRLFEIDPAQCAASGEAFRSRLHPDDRDKVLAAYRSSLASREPYRIVHRLRMPDGRIKWVEERCESEFADDGTPLRSFGTVQDIGERKAIEDALAASEARLRATLDTCPGWVACADDDLRYLYVNESFARDLGRPRDEIAGLSVEQMRGPKVAAELREINRRLLAGEQVQLERRYVAVDGIEHIHWVHYRVQPDPLRPGRHIFYAFGLDISESRRAEIRLNAIVERTRIGTWEWDPKSGRLQVNAQLPTLAGYRPEDLPADPREWLNDRICPTDRRERAERVGRALRGETDEFECEYRVRHRDGHWVWQLERGRVVSRTRAGEPIMVIGTTQDITTLKRQEQELQRLNTDLESRVERRTRELAVAKAEAERASAAKSEFVSRMSHELRTPLNAIIGFGQLLELAPLAAEEAEQVQEILRAGHHLLELINEVLDLATVESGRIQLAPEPVALRMLVDECTALIRPAALQAGLQVENRVPESCAPVIADRGRLKQVLLNLLSNAVKYNRPAGRIVVDCDGADDGHGLLRVSDTGHGLTPEQVGRLFQPFERLGAERGGIEGTGIGLSVTRRLVELMGGRIGAFSEPGTGSTFWLRLPLAGVGGAATPDPEREPSPPQPQAAPTRRRRILYFEDNAANQRLMSSILERREDIELVSSADAQGAAALAVRVRPDLILLDIQLPVLDGYQVLGQLREAGVTVPVLAVSANAMPADLERGREAGFADYLTKPLDVRRVLAAIDARLPAPGLGD